MRSIFQKIFLWFWLTIALVAATFFALGFNIREVINPNRQDLVFKTLNYFSQHALDIRANQGERGYRDYLHELEQQLSMQVYVLDQQHKLIYGEALPSRAEKLAARDS